MNTSTPRRIPLQPTAEGETLPLERRPKANRYENGSVPEGTTLTNKDYRFSQIRDVGAKLVVFEDCDFSYSVLVRIYFRNVKFLRCKLIGCRFEQCNFRSAEFSGCDFSYSWFSKTQISHADIFNQLPPRPNVRKELAQSLRKNAESIGDTTAVLECFLYEMEQTAVYLREAAQGREEYYKKKYLGFYNRVRFKLRLLRHYLSKFTWGHGESPLLVIRFALIIWFILGAWIAVLGAGAGGPELTTAPCDAITFGLKHSIFLMLGASVTGFEPMTFGTLALKGTAALFGYTIFGLMVATIVRRYVQR